MGMVTIKYDGPKKPCRYCGSERVRYYIVGNWRRLGCTDCNKWLEEQAEQVEMSVILNKIQEMYVDEEETQRIVISDKNR